MIAARKILRVVWRGALVVGVLLVVALAGAYAYTFTDSFRELARAELVRYLETAFVGRIGIERIEGSIWGDLRLRGVAVHYGDRDIARFPEVVLRYALLPILEGKVQVIGIEAPDARLDLAQDQGGKWNLADALGSKTPPPPSETNSALEIDLESVVLKNAAIELTLPDAPTYYLTEANLDAVVNVKTNGIDADVRALTVRVAREGLPIVRAEAALAYRGADSLPRAEVKKVVVASDRSKATLAATVENLASMNDMTVKAELAIDSLAADDIRVFTAQWTAADPITGRLVVDGKMSDLHAESAIAIGEAKIAAKATADAAASPQRYDATLSIEKLDVARLASSLGVAAVIDGKAHAKGAGTDPMAAEGELDVVARGVEASGWHLGEVTANGAIANRHAHLQSRVKIDGADRVALDAAADLGGSETYKATVVTTRFNPKKLSAEKVTLGGDVNLRASAEGRGFAVDKTNGRVELAVSRSKLGNVAVDRGRVDVSLAAGRVKIAEASVRAKDATFTAKGEVGLSPKDRGRLEYDLGVKNVKPWLELAGQEGEGALTIHGTASGTISDLAAEGRVQAAALRVGTSGVGRADVSYTARAIGGPNPVGRVVVTAENAEAGLALRAVRADVSLQEKQRFTAAIDAVDSATRSHRIAANGRMVGGNVDLELAELSLGSPDGVWKLANPAAIALHGRQVKIDRFVLANGGRRVTIDGTAGQTGKQALRVAVNGFTLETLQPMLAGAPPMKGAVTANAALDGTAAAPRLDARMTINELVIAGQRYEGIDASARYGEGRAVAEASFKQDATHRLTATVNAPVVVRWDPAFAANPGGEASVAVRSSGLSLAALNAFSGRQIREIAGELACDVTASGPINALQPRGTVELRDGGFVVAEYGTSISQGTIAVRLDPTQARLEKFFARGGDGTIEGSGTVPFAAESTNPIRLSFEAKNFRAASSHRYRADAEGQITVGGTTRAPEVRGRIVVLDAALRPDIAFLGKAPKPRDPTIQLVSMGTPQAPPSEGPKAPEAPKPPNAFDAATIDVTVVIQRNTWLRHEDAALDLEGEVRAAKSPGGVLSLVGEVHTAHGWAVLQGRRFTISRGSIAFTGGNEVDPTLDVVADYKKGEYVVHAIVSGTANAPALTLTSEPALEQADILSVLLFGKPADQLNDGQKTDLKQKATEMAGAYAFTEIGQSLTRALGLESKGIQVEELSTERVALGTYLTEKTYVTLGQNLGDKQGQEVAVEYEFIPDWRVQTSTSTIGGSGLDLMWHRSY